MMEDPSSVITGELSLCNKCNTHEPRNYYNWTHRQFVIRLASKIALDFEEILRKEFE